MKHFNFRPLAFLIAITLFLSQVFAVSASGYEERYPATEVFSSLSAESYVLMDAVTGAVLCQSRADAPLPMASTTKMMTCLVALEEADPFGEVTVPKEAVGVEGSSIYLVEGEKLTLLDLLYGLMLESANDAAQAIAICVSGSVEAFAEKMNEKARQIGLVNTHFVNPHGLQADQHYSTARDLSLLMRICLQNELFRELSATKTKTIPAPAGKCRYLANHNKLLRSYEYCIAGKTGFTKTAGRCLVTAAEKEGTTLICTTLGAPDDWNDHKSLFQHGFSLYSTKVLAEQGALTYSIPVVGGLHGEVAVKNASPVCASLRSEEQVASFVELPLFVYASVQEGDVIGSVVFCREGIEVGRAELIAVETVEKREVRLSFWQKILMKIRSWFE